MNNNVLRPAVLNPNAQEQAQAQPQANVETDESARLRAFIENTVAQAVARQAQPQLNPQAEEFNFRDQGILDEHRNNIADLDKTPDVVRGLREFSGNPREFASWKKGVDRILDIYAPMIGTPKYFGIINTVRNKIVGQADIILESYNTPLNWRAISKCLSMHYGDKRDITSLEYQMSSMVQGNKSVQQFYQTVYSHLSLILNKISCMEVSAEAMQLLTQTYRDKALERGLNGELPKLLAMREPTDLPQALHLCLKVNNQNLRNSLNQIPPPIPPRRNEYNNGYKRNFNNRNNNNYNRNNGFNNFNNHNDNGQYNRNNYRNKNNYQNRSSVYNQNRSFYPELMHNAQQNEFQYFNRQNNDGQRQNFQEQRRFRQPPQPMAQNQQQMDVDPSIQTRQINYMNRPSQHQAPTMSNRQPKRQRNYHIKTANNEELQDDPEGIFRSESHYIDLDMSSLPYFKFKTSNNRELKILIDTGSNKNFIRENLIVNPIASKESFKVTSIGGDVKITHHTFITMFGEKLKFYILPKLESFDALLGNDSLKTLSATIHVGKNCMFLGNKKIIIQQQEASTVNHFQLRNVNLPTESVGKLGEIMDKYPDLFAESGKKLTYITKVIGRIRTTSEEPVYSRSYPYPMALKEEVENQIKELLKDGVIRPSRSPYNSPVWVVPKKADSERVRKYRMVIDYRKLNSITVVDRYPIPDPTEIMANLGKNKVFTTLDMKRGFHQIKLAEGDIEKTAFSVNNEKYEFTRLPFGLKNAPSIFQRALDDILRDLIGKCVYVYIDDVIIFSPTIEQHWVDIEAVFTVLTDARMQIGLEKCKFFETKVQFLGFIISSEGITSCPDKVKAIVEIPYPKCIKELRAYLGLTGYYRRFIRDYAEIAKPLTSLLRSDMGRISKNEFSKVKITLNQKQKDAFDQLQNALVSNEVMLIYPDFKKPFDLTTDASEFALGAVLSQEDRPITFISRTLSKCEENYAANEREMLAIIWALTTLKNYLYGSPKINIYTDHESITCALSNKNNNAKMKRWKAFLEEYNYALFYKPGKENVVADRLSRPPEYSHFTFSVTQHSGESSPHSLIPCVEAPINAFKNQIFFDIDNAHGYTFEIVFPTYHRHTLKYPEYTIDQLESMLKKYLNPSVINCIKAPERVMGIIQEIVPLYFSTIKIRFSNIFLEDVRNENDQEELIVRTHNRAHRGLVENKKQILEHYYFPAMNRKIKNVITRCSTCKKNKYDRHPHKAVINKTPIPKYPGEILHIDIFIQGKNLAMTALDKFSKMAQARVLNGKSIENVRQPLRELLYYFGVPKRVIIDNERALNSESILFMMENDLGIEVFTTPPYCSEANGQVERFHSTLIEIMRCVKTDGRDRNFRELLERAVNEYNHSYHSTINEKPIDVFFGRKIEATPEQYEKAKQSNIQKLREQQEKDLAYHNKNTSSNKTYQVGDKIYVKINKRLGTKLDERYKEEEVLRDNNNTVETVSGRIVHKKLIKNIN